MTALKDSKLPRIALTLGDPAGIGPDIALHALTQNLNCKLVLFGSRSLLEDRARLLKIETEFLENCEIIDIPLGQVQAGIPNIQNAKWVLDTLDQAIEASLTKNCQALVTGPIHKGVLNDAGFSFTGHTEYLANKAQISTVVMSFFSPKITLGLLTTHVPLKDVPLHVTPKNIEAKLTIFYDALKQYLRRPPHIAVLGLNPHAGENGYLGQEEVEIIEPTLKRMAQKGYPCKGPLSADSAFSPLVRKEYDALFAMYHDQGLCGLKAIDFGDSVNVTLGLPFIRTSVDHGTAFDKAGTGAANPKSLVSAIHTASSFLKDIHG